MIRARFYFRGQSSYYYRPYYTYYVFWLVILGLASFLGYKFDFKSFGFALMLCFCVGLVSVLTWCFLKIRQNHSLFKFLDCLDIASRIEQDFANSKTGNTFKNLEFRRVPVVKARFKGDLIRVSFAKLSGMYSADMDKLAENITSFLPSDYAVTSQRLSADRKKFIFECQKVGENIAFTPRYIRDFDQKPYFLTLQKGLTINLSKSPHIAVWGQSGTGKTTFLFSLIAQLLTSSTKIFIIDGKDEFSSLVDFLDKNSVVSESEKILSMLEKNSEFIRERQKVVADKVRSSQKLGATAYDFGLSPVMLIADEVGSVVASMSSKDKKKFNSYFTQIAQKGRSVGVYMVVSSQSPATDVLPQGVRAQIATKILLGSANGTIQQMAFGESFESGDVPRFQGYYVSSGLTTDPQRFYVPNLKRYGFDNLYTFKKIIFVKRNEKKD